MKIGDAKEIRLLDQSWRNRNWYRYMLSDPFYSLCFVVRVFINTNRLKIKNIQSFKKLLLFFVGYPKCI